MKKETKSTASRRPRWIVISAVALVGLLAISAAQLAAGDAAGAAKTLRDTAGLWACAFIIGFLFG